MDNRTLAQIDCSDPKELRRHEDRLNKRLLRLGYSLSKGVAVSPVRKIPLKREPTKRGYKITNTFTGEVEEFWQQKNNNWWAEKRRQKQNETGV